ncbi:MAG: alpha-L-fucosidase [Leadbetterella sp.]|nr:alpha-L-fucosidase [Leadbetterella sp.]
MKKVFILCLISFATQAQSSWFEKARFGMFIHWGLYSAAEGMWKGENLRYRNNYAEWIRYRNRISKEEYGELAKRFDWENINPEEWVLLAKKSGMKYIIMTSKHHDGVALWDTKVGNYSLPNLSGSGRDVLKELAAACKKHDMKLGFYYSHWIDWEHPYAWDHNQEIKGRVTDEQFNQYWQEKAIPQLRELLTNYGDIAIMWFDMWIPYEKSIFKKEQLEQAANLIRELQPNCLINSRLGLPADTKYVDFQTLGDNVFGSQYITHPWETPGTIAHSWGYNGQEKEWKSSAQLFKSLIGNVSLNGGYTLNIGPRADGSLSWESVSRLEDLGKWLGHYGQAVYNNTGVGLRPNQHDWGKITKSGNEVYLHVFNWPLDQTLRVSGITSTPKSAQLLLENGKTRELTLEQWGPLMHIKVPKRPADGYNSIIKLEFDDISLDKNIAAESTFGGFALNASNLLNAGNFTIKKYDGTRPERIITAAEPLQWEVYLPEEGTYKIDVSAHNPSAHPLAIEIKVGDTVLKGTLNPDGKVVVEPNEKNYTDEFTDRNLGKITLKTPGKNKVEFRVAGNRELWLNRIWMEKQ